MDRRQPTLKIASKHGNHEARGRWATLLLAATQIGPWLVLSSMPPAAMSVLIPLLKGYF